MEITLKLCTRCAKRNLNEATISRREKDNKSRKFISAEKFHKNNFVINYTLFHFLANEILITCLCKLT